LEIGWTYREIGFVSNTMLPAEYINTGMNYLYQITNLINNKIYIGVHRTDNIDDGYMGSGTVIKHAIQKYSIENFKKDILEFFDTYEEALLAEKSIVTDKFLLREDVYNLRRGGFGGFDYINRNGLNFVGYDSKASYNRSISPFLHPEKYSNSIIEKIKSAQGIARDNMISEQIGIFSPEFTKNIFGLLMPKTAKHRENISKAKKHTGIGNSNSNAKSVIDNNGTIFGTVKECAIENGISENTVRVRIAQGKFKWKV